MKKTVGVGVSGGIAAYKTCALVSRLKKSGYNVKVVMTKNATEFVSPLTFETLSKNAVIKDVFAEKTNYDVEHVAFNKECSALVVAPATADVIAKFANGVADDMLTTIYAAFYGLKIICPAMNTHMYENPANLKNIELLKSRGVHIIEPTEGLLACGDVGKGRMEEPEIIADYVDKMLCPKPDCRGKRFLVTTGGTEEPIDPVRYIGNNSSGKMGVALAEAITDRGGEVILIAGNVSVPLPKCAEVVRVKTTMEMYGAVMDRMKECDVIIKAAAPADYRVKNYSENKLKGNDITLELTKNPDIAAEVGKIKGDKILVTFAAETDNLLENATRKLRQKNADITVANDVNCGVFGSDKNTVTLLYADGQVESLPEMDKYDVANAIIDGILTL